MKRALLTLAVSVWCATFAYGDVFQIGLNSTNTFTGTLNGAEEAPIPNVSTATGGEALPDGIFYDNSTMTLTLNVAYGLFGFQPLQGNYTASHIHEAPDGVAGPIRIDLTPLHIPVGTTRGLYTGSVPLSLPLETALFANQLYMNIHSSAFPGGEIRAQLIPSTVPEPGMSILLGLAGLLLVGHMRRQR